MTILALCLSIIWIKTLYCAQLVYEKPNCHCARWLPGAPIIQTSILPYFGSTLSAKSPNLTITCEGLCPA